MRVREFFKSVILFALVLSALFLTGRTWIYDKALLSSDAFGWVRRTAGLFGYVIDEPSQETPYYGKTELRTAAWPVTACMTSDGNRLGLRQDRSALTALYESVNAELGIALGTAQEPVRMTRDEWEDALSKNGVYFQFPGAVPVRAIAAWLSVDASVVLSMDVLRLGLADDGGALLLLLQDNNGLTVSCATSVSFNPALLAESSFSWEKCSFAFETDGVPPGFDRDTLLFADEPTARLARAMPVEDLKSLTDSLLSYFGISPRTTSHYTEIDGSEVYFDVLRTFRMSPQGELLYRDPGAAAAPPSDSGKYTDSALIEQARALVCTAEPWVGEAKLPLTSAYWSDGSFITKFSYELGALPSALPAAGTVIFRDGVITEARLYLRKLVYTHEYAALLPERWAMRAVPSEGRFGLLYFEENGLLTPDWAVY